jgi:pimeloyl-ACP methyl ester carboxylesterase
MFTHATESRLYVELRGEGSAVVFVHGLGGTSAIWFAQAEAVSARYRTVTYDWRGSGLSDKPHTAYSFESWAEEAAELCRELGITSAAFVGHSMAAAIVITLAARFPDLVRSIALLGPVIKLGEAGMTAIRGRADRIRKEGMPAVVDAIPQGALSPESRSADPALHGLFRAMLLANDPECYALHCEALLASQADPLVEQVRAPALLIAGECDPTAPPAAVFQLAERLRQPRVEVVAGAGHAMQLDQAARVNGILLDFLDQHS